MKMAVSATLSILALYRYDSTLFDGLQLPDGVDKETLVDNILLDAASLEVLYPDPVFLNRAINVWSKKRLPVWTELQKTLEYEYNPIDNYDRTETVTEGIERSGSGSSSRSGTNTSNGSGTSSTENSSSASGTTDVESSSSSSGTNTGTSSNTAYNSDAFADTAKSVTSGSSTGSDESTTTQSSEATESSSGTTTSTNTDTVSETGETESSSTEDRTMTTRTRGNIGVTTTQQMIQAQREVVNFNLLDVIEDEFIAKFCLAVY